jgi:hypothetical protein
VVTISLLLRSPYNLTTRGYLRRAGRDAELTDVPAGLWAAPAVDRTVAAGIVLGFPDGTYRPQAPVTRAQLAKMLVLALGLPTASILDFADVAPQAWYAPYVAAAVQAGIVRGVGGGRFDPDASVTREQMALMLARAVKLSGTGAAPFTDSGAVDPWAAPGVEAAAAAGYMGGFPDGSFQPLAPATRAQAAKVLAAALAAMAP